MTDAVVIGAGHNGLVCAAYLARAGLKTLVLERSDRIGGACVTEELWPGFKHSTASYVTSLLNPAVIEELGLSLDIRSQDPVVFHPLEEGGGLFLWEDPEARHGAISELSPQDADADARFAELFGEAARILQPFLAYPATRRHVRRAFRRSEIKRLFAQTVDGSIAELCEEHFESALMQGIHASQGVIGSAAGPRTPGSAYIYLHHALGTAAGSPGAWGTVRGGQGEITRQLAAVVEAAGGEVRLNTPVAQVKIDDRRRVFGVVLESGEEIDAQVVCSNADPKRTISLVPHDRLPPEFVADVEVLPTEGTVVKINCALSGLPRFKGLPEGLGPQHRGTITVSPSIDYLEKACSAAAEGRPAEAYFIEAWMHSATEPDLAPEGKHTLSVFAQYVPYDLAEGTWAERREAIGDSVIATLETYAPGLSSLIEHRQVLGPPDLEERFGLTGGHIFHGEMLPDWIFEKRPSRPWHRNRLPLPGFYLCGAGAHPGGGVSGVPGRNAARAVLEDLAARGQTLTG